MRQGEELSFKQAFQQMLALCRLVAFGAQLFHQGALRGDVFVDLGQMMRGLLQFFSGRHARPCRYRQNSARRMITGIGTPTIQSRIERPISILLQIIGQTMGRPICRR